MASMATVAIIGTCGRTGGDKLSPTIFNWMYEAARTTITSRFGLSPTNVQVVSGGAAWADHVAVRLFLDDYVPALTLHLPVALEETAFATNDTWSFKTNPGYSANKYHKSFTDAMGVDTIAELHAAIDKGAETHVYKGFHARNRVVSKAEYMIAFTWGEGNVPAKGGTAHTWGLSISSSKVHIPLASLPFKRKAERVEQGPVTKKQRLLSGYFTTDSKSGSPN